MILETKQLYIRALNYEELEKYSMGENPFNDWAVKISSGEISENLRPVLNNVIIPNVKLHKKEYLYFTLWLIVDKKFCLSVGSITFKGTPDINRKVEIGYGTHEEFQNKGFMTEAVEAITDWAFNDKRVNTVIAETAKDNEASFKVLENNNFSKFDENESFIYWKKEKI